MYQREDEELIAQLKNNCQNKTSEELLEIWEDNDRYTYRYEAFTAIRDILKNRKVKIPEQGTIIDTERPKEISPDKKEIMYGTVCIVSGIIITLLCFLLNTSYVIMPTGLIIYGIFILIKHQAIK